MNGDDHFGLFGLQAGFALDAPALERAWREVAAQVHPDRYATGSPAERRVAMQWAARANEAYRTLRDPLARARYLCEQAGVDLQTESNTSMRPAFLMQQLEWREALAEARQGADAAALEALAADLAAARGQIQAQVAVLLDEQRDYAGAALRVREWMFIERMSQELENARIDGRD